MIKVPANSISCTLRLRLTINISKNERIRSIKFPVQWRCTPCLRTCTCSAIPTQIRLRLTSFISENKRISSIQKGSNGGKSTHCGVMSALIFPSPIVIVSIEPWVRSERYWLKLRYGRTRDTCIPSLRSSIGASHTSRGRLGSSQNAVAFHHFRIVQRCRKEDGWMLCMVSGDEGVVFHLDGKAMRRF